MPIHCASINRHDVGRGAILDFHMERLTVEPAFLAALDWDSQQHQGTGGLPALHSWTITSLDN